MRFAQRVAWQKMRCANFPIYTVVVLIGSEGSVKDQKAVIYGQCFLMQKAGKLSVHVMFLIEGLGQIFAIQLFVFEAFPNIEVIMLAQQQDKKLMCLYSFSLIIHISKFHSS